MLFLPLVFFQIYLEKLLIRKLLLYLIGLRATLWTIFETAINSHFSSVHSFDVILQLINFQSYPGGFSDNKSLIYNLEICPNRCHSIVAVGINNFISLVSKISSGIDIYDCNFVGAEKCFSHWIAKVCRTCPTRSPRKDAKLRYGKIVCLRDRKYYKRICDHEVKNMRKWRLTVEFHRKIIPMW